MPDSDLSEGHPGYASAKTRAELLSVVVLFSIPLLSLVGRPLQHWAVSNWGREGLALVVLLLFVTIGTAFVIHACQTVRQAVLTAAALTATVWAITHGVPTAEERVHYLLFGTLGYTGVAAFGATRAAVLVLAMAFTDEGFQALLPERYGDLRDVGMNLVGGGIGLALNYLRRWLPGKP